MFEPTSLVHLSERFTHRNMTSEELNVNMLSPVDQIPLRVLLPPSKSDKDLLCVPRFVAIPLQYFYDLLVSAIDCDCKQSRTEKSQLVNVREFETVRETPGRQAHVQLRQAKDTSFA